MTRLDEIRATLDNYINQIKHDHASTTPIPDPVIIINKTEFEELLRDMIWIWNQATYWEHHQCREEWDNENI